MLTAARRLGEKVAGFELGAATAPLAPGSLTSMPSPRMHSAKSRRHWVDPWAGLSSLSLPDICGL